MIMLKSSLCKYSDAYIPLTGNVAIIGTVTATEGDNLAVIAAHNGYNTAFIFNIF